MSKWENEDMKIGSWNEQSPPAKGEKVLEHYSSKA